MNETEKGLGIMREYRIDTEELQQLQNKFCNVAKVMTYCVSETGVPLTKMSGVPSDIEIVKEHIREENVESILSRVLEDSLEDQAIEDLPIPNLKLAAISIKVKNKNILTWIVCGILSDADAEGYLEAPITEAECMITEQEFYDALDLLRESSMVMSREQIVRYNAEAESLRSKSQEKEMETTLRGVTTMIEILRLFDCDESTEVVLREFLQYIGDYLGVGHAQVLQFYRGSDKADVLSEWTNQGYVPFFDRYKEVSGWNLFNSEKVIVTSSDSIMGIEKETELAERKVSAYMVYPLLVQEQCRMVACFVQTLKDRIWTVEEVRFVSNAVKVMQNVLAKRIQKNSLASSYQALEAVLDNVGCAIYVKDKDTNQELFVNRQFKNTFSKEISEKRLDEFLEGGNAVGKSGNSFELYHEDEGSWYDMLRAEISWVDGRRTKLYSLYDVTDKKVYQKKIEQQAYTDFLTGLYNRMCCERDLARKIDEAKKRDTIGAVLYLDLDDFKHINDGLGHQFGDALLKSISGSFQRIRGIENTCYRVGGDEFVIIVSPAYYNELERIISDIKKVFSRPWYLKDGEYYCTMSMGIVEFPEEGDSVQDLIRKSDIAMYEAKRGGKNRICRYAEGEDKQSGRRLEMEKNMRDATVSGYDEFEVYYQPIIDIQKDGTPCTGAEALIRWNSSSLGFIPPNEFIPLAEYLGLINPIGNHVLKSACMACKSWNDNGHPNYKVNVNLSVVQLLQPDIVESIAVALEETGINPRNLTLEVTESLAINDMERMIEILGSIKKLGVRIALDDFGTGYSSLNHIREIPFDVIKVDRSFIKDLDEDTYSQSFVKMISELASTIGVSICVEGIERKEQYKVLEGMKVRLVQGYYFDRPMPRKDFEAKYVSADAGN